MTDCGTFAEVLQQKLGDFDPEPPAASAHAWRRPAQGPTVLHFDLRFHAAAAPSRPMFGPGAGPRVRPFVRPTPPPRPHRTLTAVEREWLDQLVRHGADLGADFTDSELRSAFRTLAKRFHPDRHLGSSASEQARLSLVFAGLSEAYRQLLGRPARAAA